MATAITTRPATIVNSITVTPTAAGATIICLYSPDGNGGTRLSGHLLHPEHAQPRQRRRHTRQLARGIAAYHDQVEHLRKIVASYCDNDGRIVSARSFRAGFKLEQHGDRWRTVLVSKSRDDRHIIGDAYEHADYPTMLADNHTRNIAPFMEWARHDRQH